MADTMQGMLCNIEIDDSVPQHKANEIIRDFIRQVIDPWYEVEDTSDSRHWNNVEIRDDIWGDHRFADSVKLIERDGSFLSFSVVAPCCAGKASARLPVIVECFEGITAKYWQIDEKRPGVAEYGLIENDELVSTVTVEINQAVFRQVFGDTSSPAVLKAPRKLTSKRARKAKPAIAEIAPSLFTYDWVLMAPPIPSLETYVKPPQLSFMDLLMAA